MITVRKEIQISGGKSPYNYQWVNNTSACIVQFNPDSGTSINGLIESNVIFINENCINNADIDLIVTDSEGCVGTYDITFENPCTNITINGFSEQINNDQLTLTALINNGSYTFNWNWDDTIFTQVSQNNSQLILNINENKPDVISSTITLTIIDNVTGCKDTNTYTYFFCNPIANDVQVNICDTTNTSSLLLDVTECTSQINWETLQVNVPNNFSVTQSSNNLQEITIVANELVANGSYTANYTVKDVQGNLSSVGFIYIELTNCSNPGSCIGSPDLIFQLTCEELALLPGVYTFINLDDIIVTQGCNPDWDTFTFIEGDGQTLVDPNTLLMLSGRVDRNNNNEITYNYTSAPSGTEVIMWTVQSDTGDISGTVQFVVNHNCNDLPVTNSDSFDQTCKAPFPFNNVLSNDTGVIDPSTVIISTQPTEGSVAVATNGTIQYTPSSTTEGNVTFGYRVQDNNGQLSNESIVTINVICAGNSRTVSLCGPNVFTLFDFIQSPKTINGTWTRISASGPAAPGTYDGTVDFTGFPSDTYQYEYEVTSGSAIDTAIITITFVDDCCSGQTEGIFLTGETLSSTSLGGTVRLSWDLGANNFFTGTVDYENTILTQTDQAVLNGTATSGSIVVTYDYDPDPWQDAIIEATINLTNSDGCACTGVISFVVPSSVGVPQTISGLLTCT